MAAGKISIQANDGKVAGIVFEDGASSDVAVTVPKDGGKLAADSTVVHKTGDETIAGVKTFSSNVVMNGNVGIGTSSPKGRIDVSSADDTAMYFRNSSANIRLRPYVTSYATSQIAAINPAGSGYTPLAIGGSYIVIETDGAERMRIGTSGNVLVTGSGGLGYGTGSGGTVTQLTSKSTTVTLNKPSGKITMNNAALTGGASVAFQINNSIVTANDTIVATIDSTYANFDYIIQAYAGSGYIQIRLLNNSGTTLSQPIGINFTVIKGAIA